MPGKVYKFCTVFGPLTQFEDIDIYPGGDLNIDLNIDICLARNLNIDIYHGDFNIDIHSGDLNVDIYLW